MTLRSLFRRRPATCADAGRKGWACRHEYERARVIAKARAMCAVMGREIPEALRP